MVLVSTPTEIQAIETTSGVATTVLPELTEGQRPSMVRHANGHRVVVFNVFEELKERGGR